MPFLLRFLERAPLWSEIETTGSVDENSSLELLIDACAKKGSGASYWQVESLSEADVGRAVAAYVSQRSSTNGLSYGHVPNSELSKLNIDFVKTAAKNSDEAYGKECHYDVVVKSVREAQIVANLLFQRSITKVSAAAVRASLLHSLRSGHMTFKDMHKELVVKLATEGELRVQDIYLTAGNTPPIPASPNEPAPPS